MDNTSQIGHCSDDSEIALDRVGDGFYTTAPNLFSEGSTPCVDQGTTCQTRPRALLMSTTSQHHPWWCTTGTMPTPPALAVVMAPLVTKLASARSMTWVIELPDVPWIFW